MTDTIDFGPSEMRLLEIGALQQRVRVLEGMNDTLHPDDVTAALGAFYKHCDGQHGFQGAVEAVILAYLKARRARALSELAAADAELLVPPLIDRLQELKRDGHLNVSPHEALEHEGAARIAQIKHDTLPEAPDCA